MAEPERASGMPENVVVYTYDDCLYHLYIHTLPITDCPFCEIKGEDSEAREGD